MNYLNFTNCLTSTESICEIRDTDFRRLHITTSMIQNVARDLSTGIGYTSHIKMKDNRGGVELFQLDTSYTVKDKVVVEKIDSVKIELCPVTQHIGNDTFALFTGMRKFQLESLGTTLILHKSGFLNGMSSMQELYISKINLLEVSSGDFCHLTFLDKVSIVYCHPSVLKGFNCRQQQPKPTFEHLQTANFTGNNISSINIELATVMPFVEELHFSDNKITVINNVVFIRLEQLRFLDLSWNAISHISPLSFTKVPQLSVLKLNNNNLQVIDYNIINKLHNLKTLHLEFNFLRIFDNSKLPTRIELLNLQNNKIETLGSESFLQRRRRNIHSVNLSNNKLVNFTLHQLIPDCRKQICREDKTLEVALSGNRLDCQCSMNWLESYRKDSHGTPLKIADITLTMQSCWNIREEINPEILEVIHLSGGQYICPKSESVNAVGCSTYNGINLYDPSAENKLIINCSNIGLHVLPANIPTSAALVRLDGNYFDVLESSNLISNSNSSEYLTKILYLNSSHIENIATGFFKYFPHLEILFLHDNMLMDIGELLINVPNIETLLLHKNWLTTVPMKVLTNNTASLKSISLSYNPWHCDCEFGFAFKEWISWHLHLVEDESSVYCGVISEKLDILQNSTLNKTQYEYYFRNGTTNSTFMPKIGIAKNKPEMVNATYVESIWKVEFSRCFPNSTIKNPMNRQLIVWLSTILGLLIIVVMLAAILLRHWPLMKVWLFNSNVTRRFWRPKKEINDGKLKDAVLIYETEKDFDLGFNKIRCELEESPPYFHLYVRLRDEGIGSGILPNLQEFIEKSRRCIFLVTDNFLKDGNCVEAFRIAHHLTTNEEKKPRIIIIFVGHPSKNDMPEDLKYYYKSRSYINFEDKWFWKKIKYDMPHVIRQPRNMDPAAYMYMEEQIRLLNTS